MDLFNQVAISIQMDLGIFYSVSDNLIRSFFTLFPVLQPWLLGAPSELPCPVDQPPCFLAPYVFPAFWCPFFSLVQFLDILLGFCGPLRARSHLFDIHYGLDYT